MTITIVARAVVRAAGSPRVDSVSRTRVLALRSPAKPAKSMCPSTHQRSDLAFRAPAAAAGLSPKDWSGAPVVREIAENS